MKSSLNLVMGCSLLLFVNACAGSKPTPAAPPPAPVDDDLRALAPAGYPIALWVNLEEFRRFPLWSNLQGMLDEEARREIAQDTGITDPLETIDEILIVGGRKASEADNGFLILIKGRLNTGQITSTVSGLQPLAPRAVVPVATTDKSNEDFAAALTERTVAWGTNNMVSAAVALCDKTGLSMANDPVFETFILEDGMAARLVASRDPSFAGKDRIPGMDRRAAAIIKKAIGAQGSLRLTAGIHVTLMVENANKLDALSTVRELNRLISRTADNPLVVLMGLDWLFDRVSVGASGNFVDISLNMSPSDISRLEELFARLDRIRNMMSSKEKDLGPQENSPPFEDDEAPPAKLRVPIPLSPLQPSTTTGEE